MRFHRVFVAALASLAACSPLAPRHLEAAEVTLTWTAPGDDGVLGTAASYELRYAFSPITEQNINASFRFTTMPAPLPAGTQQSVTVGGLTSGRTHYFVLRSIDEAGNRSTLSNVVARTPFDVVGVESASPVALDFAISGANPVRSGGTNFAISLPEEGPVDIQVYDVSGRRLKTLAEGVRPPGVTMLPWDLRTDDGARLGAGVYLVRAQVLGKAFTRRVVVTQ